MPHKKKLLIIRFSSFGDIVQAMNVIPDLAAWEIHWVCRQEFENLLASSSDVKKIFGLDRRLGLAGLFKLGQELREEKYDLVFDAHMNLRSRLLKLMLRPIPFLGPQWISRSKERLKRFMLFKLRKNFFPRPYRGMMSYRKPLQELNLIGEFPEFQRWNLPEVKSEYQNKIALCPSAAWEMKRWPLDHFKKLIELLPSEEFVVLGGPSDDFCQQLQEQFPERVINTAGELSLLQSCSVIASSRLVVSADTGLIHVAEILGVKGISLMGPTAFGFSTMENITTLEVPLSCRPCSKDGRGKCSQSVWQKCMVDITPELVSKEIELKLS